MISSYSHLHFDDTPIVKGQVLERDWTIVSHGVASVWMMQLL